MMNLRTLRIALCGAVLTALAPSVYAAEDGQPRLQATYGQWNAYTMIEDGKKVCFMASEPIGKPKPKFVDGQPVPSGVKSWRGDVYALVTHRPSENARDVFSFIAGYDYKPGADAILGIDGEKFKLFVNGDTAWAPDAPTDSKIAKALQAGKTLTMSGMSKSGKKTTDTMPLAGAADAYKWITNACY